MIKGEMGGRQMIGRRQERTEGEKEGTWMDGQVVDKPVIGGQIKLDMRGHVIDKRC